MTFPIGAPLQNKEKNMKHPHFFLGMSLFVEWAICRPSVLVQVHSIITFNDSIRITITQIVGETEANSAQDE